MPEPSEAKRRATGRRRSVTRRQIVFFAVVVFILSGLTFTSLSQPDGVRDHHQTHPVTLSHEEALEQFRALKALWARAYRDRDLSLVSHFVAPDARPPFSEIGGEIRSLLRQGVLDRTSLRTKTFEVMSRTREEVRIKETAIRTPKFIDEESGDDITVKPKQELLVVVWTMRRYGTEWLIYRSTIIDATALPKNMAQ